MSTKQLDRYEADNLLFSQFGLVIDLPEGGFFYEITDDLTGNMSLVWTPEEIFNYEKLFSAGVELVATRDKKKLILPSIMEFSKDPRVEISSLKLIDRVTKGKEIEVNRFGRYEGKPIIITYHDKPVAYGTVLSGEFTPLVDVGLYLRVGD